MSYNFKKDFVLRYTQTGPGKFYKFLLSSAIVKVSLLLENEESNKQFRFPDQELLDYYEKFLMFYRRENEDIYMEIAKLCRKAAHKIYRELLRQKIIERNGKFLNLIPDGRN